MAAQHWRRDEEVNHTHVAPSLLSQRAPIYFPARVSHFILMYFPRFFPYRAFVLRSTGIPLERTRAEAAEAVARNKASGPGTVPEVDTPLPFRIHRTHVNGLPVYHDFRQGTRQVTIVRKFAGDVQALGRALETLCASRVTLYHGRIEVKGLHRSRIKWWIESLGF